MINFEMLFTHQTSGRIPKPDPKAIDKVIEGFKSRNITYYRLARAVGVSASSARAWYEGRNISQSRLAQLKELLEEVEDYEAKNQKNSVEPLLQANMDAL